ncbi:Uncharacterised protein [Mycobacterium tuberculosis]|nr:Uncharacterised protein [Mycobacterium tuberculosis]CNC54973.1 Uncharacterised protein [Mycobacterium tuberculosis]CNI19797.1 Uncharacterised protein [Mycobacterium tuberculosis]
MPGRFTVVTRCVLHIGSLGTSATVTAVTRVPVGLVGHRRQRFLRALICRRWAGIAATAVSGLVGVSRQIGIDEFVIELPAKTT